MKRLKYLVLLLITVLFVPFAVYATDEAATTTGEEQVTTEEAATEESKEVKVYLFRGETCPHCQEAEEWFQSIEAEYGSYFEIVDYETWEHEENVDIFREVLKARGEYVSDEESLGVPYILIGDKSWNGFTEEYEQEIIDQIKQVFAQDVSERYDIMKYIESGTTPKKESAEKSGASDAIILLVILLVCGGAGFGIYQARKNTK